MISGETYLAVTNHGNTGYFNIDSKIYKWDPELGESGAFVEIQAILTHAAAGWESFEILGETYLIVANTYNGSTFNILSRIYKWNGASFVEIQAILTNGTRGWESFTIAGETYLAVANYRSDHYVPNVPSHIYKRDPVSSVFVEVQAILTNGANDVESFKIAGETYLAVANFNPDWSPENFESRVYEWNGTSFDIIQEFDTNGAQDWESFEIAGETYLAVANYYGGVSKIYKANINQPVCFSNVATIDGLMDEVDSLDTSTSTINTLYNTLDNAQKALDNGNHKTARERMGKFIRKAVNRSNFKETNPNIINLDEANSLICGAANVLIGIPLE